MGFTPRQVDQMTLWEFIACREGFAEFHSSKPRARENDMDDETLQQLGIEGFT